MYPRRRPRRPHSRRGGAVLNPPAETEALTEREIDRIIDLAHSSCGIDLSKGKKELIQARLGRKIRQGNFASFRQYYDHVTADRTGEELLALVDALTTNFTSFLREPVHFDFLRRHIVRSLHGPIRIWSAACSTGEEPYTIAMSLLEELGSAATGRVRILASDISTRALAAAERGIYESGRFRDFPPDWRSNYLLRGAERAAGFYRIKPAVRRLVEFTRINLNEPFPAAPAFHAIFCRNVMIYFDKETQGRLVNRLASFLEPGGWLLIGHSESLTGLSHPYDYVQPAVYRRRS
jgi:chemotaxis protein methyltransferase CheR